MNNSLSHLATLLLLGATLAGRTASCEAGSLTLRLENDARVTSVGASRRWDQDGNPAFPVDPRAKIDQPRVDAWARQTAAGTWRFENLPAGRYDLVILAKDKLRIEGLHYPPVLEFDPVLVHDGQVPASARDWIERHIEQSRHYENKVTPLYFAGDEKQIRVFVQLLRDQPTSYDRQFGQQVATLRHEVWQYTNYYGGWAKEKNVRIFDRILMPKRQLRAWTWIWEPKLGGILVDEGPVEVKFRIPDQAEQANPRGLVPY
jgi:hypothetical protein